MAFDIQGARNAGYSDAEIADFVAGDTDIGFDVRGALKAGYSPSEVLEEIGRGAPKYVNPNGFSNDLPDRRSYEASFLAANPGADSAALANAMEQYDAHSEAVAKEKAKPKSVGPLSSDQEFTRRLDERLAGPRRGIVPRLPTTKDIADISAKVNAAQEEGAAKASEDSGALSYLGRSLQAGAYDLAGATAKILDAVNPFTLSEGDAAILFKDDPDQLKQVQEESASLILSRFAHSMTKKGEESMAKISPEAKYNYAGLEYATLDPNKTAFAKPAKVLGDAVRSLPTTAAMAVTIYVTRGAATQAETQALEAGLSAEAARQAGIQAAQRTMAIVGAGSEGAVGYAQQYLQTYERANQASMENSPRFKALLEEGFSLEAARAKIAADTAEESGQIAGIVDAAVNKVGGNFLGKILTEGGPFIQRVMKGAANEAATEAVQSAGEQFGENWATKQNVDKTQSLSQGTGEAAVQGMAAGGLTGGAFAGIGGKGPGASDQINDAAAADNARQTALEKGAALFGQTSAFGQAARGTPTVRDIAAAQSVDEAIATAQAVVNAPIPMPTQQAAIAELETEAGLADIPEATPASMATPQVAPQDTPQVEPATDVKLLPPDALLLLRNNQPETALGQQAAQELKRREVEYAYRQAEERKAKEMELAEKQRRDQEVEQAEAVTKASGFDTAEPTAMQLAMQRARQKLVTTPVSKRTEQGASNAQPVASQPEGNPAAADVEARPQIQPRPETARPADAQPAPNREANPAGPARAVDTDADARDAGSIEQPALTTTESDEKVYSRTNEKKPIFYSQLARAIENAPAKIDNGPAGQWKAWVASNASKLGVKADEIKWSGLDDYLDMKRGQKLSKSEISEYLAQNGVQVQEVTRGARQAEQEPLLTAADVEVWSEGNHWMIDSTAGNKLVPKESYPTEDSARDFGLRYWNSHINERNRETTKNADDTKYASYTLPGGENYRELLLTLPEKNPRSLNEIAQEMYGKRFSELEDDEANKVVTAENNEKKAGNYKSSHWDEKNILAHIRFNDRIDVAGKRVLFIEELQSDWGQEGKKKGFNGEGERLNELSALTGEDVRNPGVPSAPFVTDTKSWLSLGIKRMIRYAAENGYDRIAVITGQQSADRYDLSKTVDSITLRDSDRRLVVTGKDGGKLFAESGVSDERIADVVGKEMADKLKQAKPDYNGVRLVDGDGLKVGGEGMITFYDKIVPQTVNDVLKKLGGGRVEQITVKTGNAPDKVVAQYADQPDHPFTKAQRAVVNGFDITPEMRDQAMQGLPLFRRDPQFTLGMPVEDVQSEVDRLSAKWENAPKINVVDSVSELPFAAPPDVRGVYARNQVWLVSQNVRTELDVQQTLFHEVLGHAGLRGMFGDRLNGEMEAIAAKNANIQELARKWRARNEDIQSRYSKERWVAVSIEEALAETAEQGKQIKGFDRLLATLQKALRAIGFDKLANWMESASNAEVMDLLANARRYIESGPQVEAPAGQEAQAFQRKTPEKSFSRSENGEVENVLKTISEIDELFRIPKSSADTVEGIVNDVAPEIQVKKMTGIPGETRCQLTLPDGTIARLMERPFNKYGDSIYGFSLEDGEMSDMEAGRPGKNAEEVDGKGDVWIDVSLLKPGGSYGAKIYSIAANYAHNTGKVFIGDPAGVSEDAMRRRPEQMLSSALKFGTTEHLAPHPKQIKGDKQKGIPPLDWVYGDDFGNIKRLIEFSLKNIDNAGGNGDIVYNPEKDQFEDSNGNSLSRDDIAGMAVVGLGRSGSAGSSTLARYALFKSLIQGEGGRGRGENWRSDDLLEALVAQLRQSNSADGNSSLNRLFYSRKSVDQSPQDKETAARDGVRSAFGDAITIDGKERPRNNSEGKPIAYTTAGLEAFYKWFADSKVVDAEGRPLVVYHGSNQQEIEAFDPDSVGDNFNQDSRGFFFTDDKKEAERYARNTSYGTTRDEPGAVIGAYLALKKPLVKRIDFDPINEWDNDHEQIQTEADSQDADGVIIKAQKYQSMYVAFEPTQIKSVDNIGTFNPDDDRIMFSRKPASSWMVEPPSKIDDFIYSIQDKQVDTKRVVQAIREKAGKIEDNWNPYLQEELFHSRSAKQVTDFLNKELKPLLIDMQARGVQMQDFEEYLHMRHAEERNNQIAKVNPDMQDGGSGVDTKDARAYLSNLPAGKKRAYEALAKRVDAINKNTRQILIDSGLEKPETIAAWEGAYQYYVPLQREESGQGVGQGFSVRGSSTKRAMGSKKDVINILANIAMQREKAVVRAEKNRVSTALYGLAITSPNPDFWLPINPEKLDAAKQAELVKLGLNPADVKNLADEPTQQYIDPRTGLVAERVNPFLRSAQNVLATRVNGEDRYVFFNEDDERAMRMVKALKNLDADQLGRLLSMSAKVSRFFAAVNTQYNPIFGIINLTRDVQGSLMNLSTTPLAGKQKEVAAHTLSALRGIYIDLRDQRAGKPSTSSWANLFEEFQKEGGQTGYRNMFSSSQERADALEREIKRISEGKVKQAGRAIFDWLSDYNETMENAVRLACYKVGKEQGLTNQQAASVAKNISVNFNRKGQISTQAGALYAFFNANVQGTARIVETLKGPAGKKIIAGGLLLGFMQALALAVAGYDEDEPPEFVKSRNIIIPLANGKYLTIPMPLGFNALPNMSRITTEYVLGGFKNSTKHLTSLIDVFADTMNPIGNAGLSMQTIAPTALDPLAALAENRDWTGKPIAKEDPSGLAPTPGYTRAKDTASEFSKATSYWLNLATGGTKYKKGLVSPTPDQLDYLIGQATGGVGREAMKVEQTVTSTFTGEDLPAHKIPLVGRFYGDTKGQSSVSSKFYDNLKMLNEHEAEITGRRKDKGDVVGYLRDHPEARLVTVANEIERQVQELTKHKRELLQKDASKERIKLIEQQITSRMQKLNDRVKAVSEKKPVTEAN